MTRAERRRILEEVWTQMNNIRGELNGDDSAILYIAMKAVEVVKTRQRQRDLEQGKV